LLNIRLNQLGDDLFNNVALKNVFAPTGVIPSEGTLIKRTILANTLEAISNNGPDALYTGQIASDLASDIQAEKGIITTTDLANYQAKRRETITSFYKGYGVVCGPPPSSGVVVSFILNLLEKFQLDRLSSTNILTYHYLIEALKHGFAHRNYLADISFANITNFVSKMSSKQYASTVNQKFNSGKTFPPEYYLIGDEVVTNSAGTSHVSIIDKDRNAVALTNSVNLNFGSKILSAKTGILLNNQMDDFSTQINETNTFGLRQSAYNSIAPRKRPMSSMSPMLMFDGPNVLMAIGSSGGPTIISSLLQVLLNIQDYKKEVKGSVDAPRLHSQLFPYRVDVEPGIPAIILDTLGDLGHNISKISSIADGQFGVGNVQVVVNRGDSLAGAADDRKLGEPSGY
jgi:gamma-glutamyltranspeptidase / glutathione hydrolase / leukotriene-C4 hydrolase